MTALHRFKLIFLQALSVVGTDFSIMESIFKTRTRQELKLKFKKEERSNRALIDKCLREGGQFDMSIFGDDSDEDEDDENDGPSDLTKSKAKCVTCEQLSLECQSKRLLRIFQTSFKSSAPEEAAFRSNCCFTLNELNVGAKQRDAVEPGASFPFGIAARSTRVGQTSSQSGAGRGQETGAGHDRDVDHYAFVRGESHK